MESVVQRVGELVFVQVIPRPYEVEIILPVTPVREIK